MEVKPAKFEYHAPQTLDALVALLAEHGDDGKILAGGQSLVPVMNFRLARPAKLFDLNGIAALDFLREEKNILKIGALVRHAAFHKAVVAGPTGALLKETARHIAHYPIRQRGTFAGSIAHADPASELCAVLLVLDGRVIARSPRGERVIAAGDFFRGPMDSALEPDELVTETWFPATRGPVAIAEEARRHGDFAMAGAVRAGDRLAVFGVAPRPLLADPADPARGLRPSAEPECSPEFRLHLLAAVVERVMAG